MRMPFLIAAILALSFGGTALAQSDDTKAILDLLKSLDERLGKIEGKVDKLEAGRGIETPETGNNGDLGAVQQEAATQDQRADAAQNKQSHLPMGTRAVAGWVVSALPYQESNREPDTLFRFPAPKLPISFDDHLSTRQMDDFVKYRGEALLNISEPGRYVFAASVQAPKDYDARCGGYVKIGKNVIIDLGNETDRNNSTRVSREQNRLFTGGITLEPGNYDLSFLSACLLWGRDPPFDSQERQNWHSISFDLQIRGPADEVLRPFGAKELFYLVREKKASSATVEPNSAPDAVPVEPPGKGSKRLVNLPVNVRNKPDVTGAAVRKLVPGDQIVVLDHAAGGQWVSVEVDGQFIGFVKTTALLANSQEL